MNIGMLLNAPYPSDVRVKKEANALMANGFKVHLLCLREKDEKEHEEVEGIHITRINGGKNNYALAFWDIIMSVTFQHPVFKKAIVPWVSSNSIKLLHIHDLPLVGTALAVRRRLAIPVIADFHENYPEALKTWFEWKTNPLSILKNKLFMNYAVWSDHEKKAVLESDHVIAVVEEMKNRLVLGYQVPVEKITVVTNSEERSFLNQVEDPLIYKDYHQHYPDKFIITYSGNIGPHRGVDTVIESMQYLSDYPQICLIIVGSGSQAVMKNLKDRVERLRLTNQVYFLGRQPFSKFYSFMKFADANIIPHKSNSHTDNTIPHKLFQAMMVGKPVIVSTSAPLKRIVSKANSGIIFQVGDAADLSKKIIKLYSDKKLQMQLATNGKKATLEGEMNWEHDSKALIDVYRNTLNSKTVS